MPVVSGVQTASPPPSQKAVSTTSSSSGSGSGSGSGAGSGGGGSTSVRAQQMALNKLGANLVVDGINGPKTRAAAARYGGGTTSNPTNPTVDTTTTGGTSTGGGRTTSQQNAEVADLRARQLEAALASINATFGGNITEQQGLLAALAPALASYTALNKRESRVAREDVNDALINRGIFQSGIAISDRTEAQTPYTEALAERTRQSGVSRRQHQSNVEALKAQRAAKRHEARLASEKDKLDFDLFIAQQA